MLSRFFWIFAGLLFAASLAMLMAGGPGISGLTDYRAWLLLAFGLIAAALGNVARPPDDGHRHG